MHLRQFPVDLAAEVIAAVLVDEVPLVERQHQRPARLDHHRQHPLVLLGQQLRGVDQHDDHLGGVDCAVGSHRCVELMSAGLADLATQSRGIDETPSLAAQFDQRVDRVHGGARLIVHDCPLVADKLVQQGTLPDVRLAHQRDPPWPATAGAGLGHRGQGLDDLVEQVGHSAAVYGADRVRLAQSQRPQRRGIGLAALCVHLVGGQEHGLAGLAQHPRRRLVACRRAHHGVDHQDDRVGGSHGDRRLIGHQLLQALRVGFPATGVLHEKTAPHPVRVVRDPVPRHAGYVLNHCLAATENAIDQGGLADVRAPDDRDHRRRTRGALGILGFFRIG